MSETWKQALLDSHMPLEYEAAQTLVAEGFAVGAGFKHARHEHDSLAETAVAIHAVGKPPFSRANEADGRLDLLVECRHCFPGSRFLFLPDPNPAQAAPVPPGHAIRAVDQFSPYVIENNAGTDFERSAAFCYRGLEINPETGQADDRALQADIDGLRYALPRLFSENIIHVFSGLPEENRPFFFCPILLTTARLWVAQPERMSVAAVQKAERIRQFADEVPYLILYSDYGPDFQSQCQYKCRGLKILLHESDEAMSIEQRKARYYQSRWNLPFTLIDALLSGERFHLNRFFTQFLVCNQSAFGRLVAAIQEAVCQSLESGVWLR